MRNKKNIRTCLGCQNKKDKQELYRITNIRKEDDKKLDNNEDNIIFDKDQKLGGRGTYVCSLKCFEKAIENSFFQKRIRSKLSINKIEELRKAISRE